MTMPHTTLWSSDIVASALGARPTSVTFTWSQATPAACSHCGKPIETGHAYVPADMGEAFSDNTRDLAAFSGAICWACDHLRKKPLLNAFSAVLITQDCVYPMFESGHKAWAFLTPPKAPFLFMHSSSTMQHLAWRTPVTVDSERIAVRFGPQILTIRPSYLRQAIDDAVSIQAAQIELQAGLAATAATKSERTAAAQRTKSIGLRPMQLDNKLKDPGHGEFFVGAKRVMTPAQHKRLLALTLGETWALAHLLTSKGPAAPVQPPRMEFVRNSDGYFTRKKD